MVATGARILEKAHKLCSEHFPERTRELDYAYIMWHERNATELRAVVAGEMADSTIAEAGAVAGLLRLKALDAAKLDTYCQGYAAQLPQGCTTFRCESRVLLASSRNSCTTSH